jgi:hypothetical protein
MTDHTPASTSAESRSGASIALGRLSADSRAGEDWPDLYGPLIGSWVVESEFVTSDGEVRKSQGEWHFERILGGMGVQDVLFAAGAEPDQYGTTLRVVDPRTGLWHGVWMQPQSGEFVVLVGRAEGEGIVHQGHPLDDPDGPLQRWSFTHISASSFTWTGESSHDGGASWSRDQRMLATRLDGHHESSD